MKFKEYIKIRVVPGFFVTVTCITFAMAVMGIILEPDAVVSYRILFSPFIYGLAAAFIQLIQYSPTELTPKQAILRKIVHFLVLEMGILAIAYKGKALSSMWVTVSMIVSILIIYLAVSLIMWLHDKRSCILMNDMLKELQKEYDIFIDRQ